MKLIITRHGETKENESGIFQGHLPGKLSKEGIKQAKRVAERLNDEKVDFIYSSDLARAADTAREISKFHKETPLIFTTELRERNLGEFQGKSKKDLGLDKGISLLDIKIKKGESLKQLYDRGKTFLHKVLHKHKDNTVLFVAHNGIDKMLMAVIKNKPFNEIINIEKLGNTSINIFEIDENKNHKIILFNCTKHL